MPGESSVADSPTAALLPLAGCRTEGTDGQLWKYWGDAVRADGEQGGAAARLLAAGAGEFEWAVAEGPEWQGPIWVKKQPTSPKL